MYQIVKVKYSIYNYVITFLIYISNIIQYLVSPIKKKYAKIHSILDTQYIYDEEANYYNVNTMTNCKIEFDTLKDKPITHYYVKTYRRKNIKCKID